MTCLTQGCVLCIEDKSEGFCTTDHISDQSKRFLYEDISLCPPVVHCDTCNDKNLHHGRACLKRRLCKSLFITLFKLYLFDYKKNYIAHKIFSASNEIGEFALFCNG